MVLYLLSLVGRDLSLVGRIHRSKDQEVEVGVALRITSLHDPSFPETLGSVGLEVLIPGDNSGVNLLFGNTIRVPLNLKLWLLPCRFGVLMLVDERAKDEVSIPAGVIDSDHQEETELLLYNRSR